MVIMNGSRRTCQQWLLFTCFSTPVSALVLVGANFGTSHGQRIGECVCKMDRIRRVTHKILHAKAPSDIAGGLLTKPGPLSKISVRACSGLCVSRSVYQGFHLRASIWGLARLGSFYNSLQSSPSVRQASKVGNKSRLGSTMVAIR